MTDFKQWTSTLKDMEGYFAAGKAIDQLGRKIPPHKRLKFLKFVSAIDIEREDGNSDFRTFLDSFEDMVRSVPKKINSKVFETIVTIGVKLGRTISDQFWFALMNSNDYGRLFDQPRAVAILIEKLVLNDQDSWKAALLLCILAHEYPNVKDLVASELLKIGSKLTGILKDVEQYVLAAYLVELISQIDSSDLIDLIIGTETIAFPKDAHANDSQSMKFFKSFSVFAPNINRFKRLTMNNGIFSSGPSILQVNETNLVIVCEVGESATPIQIDFSIITKAEQNRSNLMIELSREPKYAMINPLKFPDDIWLNIEMYSGDGIPKIISEINGNRFVTSTPARKISVVENFISLNNVYHEEDEINYYDEVDEEKDRDTQGVEDYPNLDSARTESAEPMVEPTLDSEISEKNSMFHSPINITKDTSVSTRKKNTSTVSNIVAESTRNHQKPLFPDASQQLIIESSQPLDTNIKTFEEHSKSEKSFAKTPRKKTTVDDIWDFLSSEEENRTEDTPMKQEVPKPRRKSIFAPQLSGKAKVLKEKTSVVSKSTELKSKPKVSKNEQMMLSSLDNHESTFSGMTSPVIHAQARATTRALSMASNKQEKKGSNKRGQDEITEKVPATSFKNGKKNRETRKSMASNNKRTRMASGRLEKTPVRLTQVFSSDTAESDPIEDDDKDPDFVDSPLGSQRISEPPIPPKPTRSIPRVRPGRKAKGKPAVSPIPEQVQVQSVENEPVNKVQHTLQEQINHSQGLSQDGKLTKLSDPRPNTPHLSVVSADHLLSEAYTTTLQKQIFESITSFSNQLVRKIQIINNEINKKVMADLTAKYESLFNDLRGSFQNDVNEISSFIGDVKGLLNLPEEELVAYINERKFGSGGPKSANG